MKKKILALFFAMMMVFSLAACGGGVSDETALEIQDKYTTLAETYTELMELAATYGLDEVNAANLQDIGNAISEVGQIISQELTKASEEEGQGILEQLDTLQGTLDPYYSLFE